MTALESVLLTGFFTLAAVGLTFVGTLRANRETIRAERHTLGLTLGAARDDKIWDKQTAAYEEIIAYLLFIQAKRRLDVRRRHARYNEEYEQAAQRLLGDYKPASWWELQARLAAYGSSEAIAGFEASHKADTDVAVTLIRLADLEQQSKDARQSGAPHQAPPIEDVHTARKDLDETHGRADETDQGLVKLMRSELNSKPMQGDTVAVPVVGNSHRRRWRPASSP